MASTCVGRDRHELHRARGTLPRLAALYLGMHRARVDERDSARHELHRTLRALAGLRAHDFRVHRAEVLGGSLGRLEVHLGHEPQRLVRRGVQVRRDALALGDHLRVGPKLTNASAGPGSAGSVHLDGAQRVGTSWRPMLQRRRSGRVEEDVEDDSLRRREDHRLDELLVLAATAVATDDLHPCVGDREVEDAGVGGVREVEADHLSRRAERSAPAPR